MQAVSTPFHGGSGRRFEPEEDENTCAVHIAFKKPLLPPRISGISALPEREETSIREASRGQGVVTNAIFSICTKVRGQSRVKK